MSFLNSCLKWGTRLQAKKFESSCRNIEEVFKKNWEKTISTLIFDDSYWGKKGYSRKSKLEDFPISNYEQYEKVIQESMRTGISKLNNEKILFAAMTSGTNGTMKPFLITNKYKKQYQLVTGPTVHYLTKKYDIGKGKFLYLISLSSASFIKANVRTGTIGNFTYKTLPFYLKFFYSIPFHVFTSKEKFKKYAYHYAVAADMSAIFSVTPPIAINFLSQVFTHLSEIIDDLLDENFIKKSGIALSKERRIFLKELKSSNNIQGIDLWPKLLTMTTWTTSVCKLSLPKLKSLLNEKVKVVDGIYSATEGWVTVQNNLDQEGCTYHPGGTLLEFIPEGEELIAGNIIKPWELEEGKCYEILFTNVMGLVRYRIGDVVKCNGFFARSPILVFSHKTSASISLGIIRLSEGELIEATLGFVKKFQDISYFFSFSQDGLSLGIYFYCKDDNYDSNDLNNTLLEIEEKLQEISLDYKKERANGTIKPLQFYRLKIEEKYFVTDETGQRKPRLIINERIEI